MVEQNILYKICKYDTSNTHIVISLKDKGKYFSLLKKFRDRSNYVKYMNFYSVYKVLSLIKKINYFKPDIVQTWLVHDFLGGIASRLAGFKNIIWNIRYSNIEATGLKFSTIFIIKILSWLSYIIPSSIIIVSKRAKKLYEKKGFDNKKLKYIPNGFDLSYF